MGKLPASVVKTVSLASFAPVILCASAAKSSEYQGRTTGS